MKMQIYASLYSLWHVFYLGSLETCYRSQKYYREYGAQSATCLEWTMVGAGLDRKLTNMSIIG